MKRKKVEIFFGIILLVVSIVLSETTIIFKGMLIEHPFTIPVFSLVVIGLILLNHYIIRMNLIVNFIYSFLITPLSLVLSLLISDMIISIMLEIDNQRTPLGWTFNYTWSTLFIFGIMLILCTELIGVRLGKSKKQD